MTRITGERLEVFINDVLKSDLRQLEQIMDKYNTEITEYEQLRSTLQTLQDMPNFKSRMDIGANIFMQAQVTSDGNVLVDIGKGIYLQMSLEEAINFCGVKAKILNKQCEVAREESIKKRTEIKLAVMAKAEEEKLLEEERQD